MREIETSYQSTHLTKAPHNGCVRVVLISTYELGRQPFGLASPAAWLRAAGHDVTVADLACSPLPRAAVEEAELIAFFLPMHTATRLFLRVVERVRGMNPEARLCGYGLYAPLNAPMLRRAGVRTIIGGEFEQPLVDVANGALTQSAGAPCVSLARQQFLVPDRSGLAPLGAYAQLVTNGTVQRATRNRRADASTCAATARWFRCTRERFVWCSGMWCWPTSGSKSPPGPSTSPSAIPISSMGPDMAWRLWKRCTASGQHSLTT